MTNIAVLIPTIGRADRLEKVAKNIHDNIKESHKLYFCLEKRDTESIDIVTKMGEAIIFNELNNYVGAINTGYLRTTEPFIMCASDDLDFKTGWDKACMEVMKNPTIGITGCKDSWTISKSGKHISHLFVRRTYIEKFGGVEDEPNSIYSNKYLHIMCDIETEQVAIKRNAFELADGTVEHNHWFTGNAVKDATYELAQVVSGADVQTYETRRRNFEQYLFEALFIGRQVKIHHGLSIVLPSLNILPYLSQTLESLKANTYTKDYELIIIDDASDDQTKAWIRRYEQDGIKIKRVLHEQPHGVNANWNLGISMATNEYVAVINNDITLSKDWDIWLMDALDRAELANPYQTDPYQKEAYGKDMRAGGIDIRGTCFMAKKKDFENIGPIPKELYHWFGDSWLATRLQPSVFVPEAVIHHFGSKSTEEFDARTHLFWWQVRGDYFAYQTISGEHRKDLWEAIEKHL